MYIFGVLCGEFHKFSFGDDIVKIIMGYEEYIFMLIDLLG